MNRAARISGMQFQSTRRRRIGRADGLADLVAAGASLPSPFPWRAMRRSIAPGWMLTVVLLLAYRATNQIRCLRTKSSAAAASSQREQPRQVGRGRCAWEDLGTGHVPGHLPSRGTSQRHRARVVDRAGGERPELHDIPTSRSRPPFTEWAGDPATIQSLWSG